MKYLTDVEQKQAQENQTESIEPFTWMWFLATVAEGIIATAAGMAFKQFIKDTFGMDTDYKQLIHKAVNEIVDRVNSHIDQILIGDLIGNCEHIRSHYLTYLETRIVDSPDEDKRRLNTLLDLEKLSDSTVNDLKSQFEAHEILPALGVACSLHLFLIIELIPHLPGYKDTLKRFSAVYGNLLENAANQYLDLVKTNVGECTGRCYTIRDDIRPDRLRNLQSEIFRKDCHYEFTFNYGRENRKFDGESAEHECKEARAIYYNDRVNPATEMKDIFLDLANSFRKLPEKEGL